MDKFLKRKSLTCALALIIGTTILITPLVAYAANPPSGFWQKGKVGGNGIRHRRTPGLDGEILGLMYDGETIWINPDEYDKNYAAWVYIWREKTELKGWMEWSYFVHE